jgi:hypothetical chaperone protein
MIGFDYGTSNCAVGVMENNKPNLLSLGDHGRYVISSLYAPSRDIIVNWLLKHLTLTGQKIFCEQRQRQLQRGQNALRELELDGYSTELSFGQQALDNYLHEPDEGYYIKSPQTVIGRPINFQGLQSEESNRQAIDILTKAAKRVGFIDVDFQYEPVAAGFEYEESLTSETKVLVVDIGGGTTDCSMLLMGPKQATQIDRRQHFLSHSGERVGGNDLDIALALKGFMPSFGLNSQLKTGRPMPVHSFWQAMAINNINDQTEFYSSANERVIQQLIRASKQPALISRLLTIQQQRLSYRMVNAAEQSKIALTDNEHHQIDLFDIDTNLSITLERSHFSSACQRELTSIAGLMKEAITQANCQPDVVFVTGGTAKSPVINQFLKQKFEQTPIIVGDYFGSVTSGLARWANRIYS